MPCYKPLKMFRPDPKSGDNRLTGNPLKAFNSNHPVTVGCGQCIGCRLDHADQWATRLSHEAQMHPDNCFITLTYDDDHVPRDYSVKIDHWQRFMKRLRSSTGIKMRYCACAEYGENGLRPHMHALLFGYDFPDKVKFRMRDGYPVYTSELLSKLWPDGSHEIGSAEAESAGYVARYCLKKQNGSAAEEHYTRISPMTGELHRVDREWMVMSRRPGIGASWYAKFKGDCFPSDFLIVGNARKPIPRFYLDRYAEEHPGHSASPRPGYFLRDIASGGDDQIKRKRIAKASTPQVKRNNTPERLRVREEVRLARLKNLKREGVL